jgi:hypothetical protein
MDLICLAVKVAAAKKKMRAGRMHADLQSIRFTDLNTKLRYIFWTPVRCLRAIHDFDQGIKPKPFSFKLRPVQVLITDK